MRFCENCGKELKEGDIYCPKCGKNQSNSVTNNNKTNKEGLGTASMALGIISLIFAFIINLFVLPLALVGLILGIVNKAQNGKKISGIILNGIAMIVSVIVFIALIFFIVTVADDDDSDNYNEYLPSEEEQEEVLGAWNCKSVDNILNSDYEIVLTLNTNKSFTIGEYNNTDKNYIKGVYYFEDSDLNNFMSSSKYHAIGLNPLEKYENGDLVKKSDDTDYKYEMLIAKTKGKFYTVLTNDGNDKVYYCNK